MTSHIGLAHRLSGESRIACREIEREILTFYVCDWSAEEEGGTHSAFKVGSGATYLSYMNNSGKMEGNIGNASWVR